MGSETLILNAPSDELVGTYIFKTGKDYYVGNISGKNKTGGLIIHRESDYLSLDECEDFCYKMGRIAKMVLREDTLEILKDKHSRAS